MIYNLYSIRDSKTGFMMPTYDINDQSASRAFAHVCVNSHDVLSSFVKDFDLYRIAEFDSESGVVQPVSPIQFVISGPDAFRLLTGVDSNA